jgi:ELWxxDGT repeat protein
VIYFGRSEPDIGRELWRLDATDPRGASLVLDLNMEAAPGSYAPALVTAVPDPLDLVMI